ncbi:GDSL-type esterase/lipase family protein [Frankia sp. AgPm24]|uniref:GDSL-type esterase/lipase family protein n=1 Tax=Frankia sp. AgPm24 TaxID=631128 RepID=UPI002010B4CC|nr:GDSL-type esterase/lipase family protein [Frankia sp. AgPm24]MCK9925337.1 GDSL-type esterase/lipase family protein [Frankia sp. AgPm24]
MSLRGRGLKMVMKPFARIRSTQVAALGAAPGSVVVLGDGLAASGNWEEWFAGVPVRNFGIDALLIDELRSLLPHLGAPRAVVVLIGTSDLLGLGGSGEPRRAAERLARAVEAIQARVGTAPVVVVGVPPRHLVRAAVDRFNRRAADLVAARGAVFVDVTTAQTEQDASDGFLLSVGRWDAAVYASVAAAVRPFLPPAGLASVETRPGQEPR